MCTSMSCRNQRGISLIELIMFIVIISTALVGILSVMNLTTSHSADAVVRKKAIAAAESLLEEIELQDFISASGAPAAVTQTNRATDYHIVSNYAGFTPGGVFPVSGVAPIVGLEGYSATVAVIPSALGAIPAGSAVLITVTVSTPQGEDISISGYRAAY